MIFYDFEVFKHDWLAVFLDMDEQKEHVIVNDHRALRELHEANKGNIWVGFNNKHYDQYIMRGILTGYDPKRINDFIIIGGRAGWEFGNFRKYPMINYDVMGTLDGGLKKFEGFMGHDIKESSVPFNIDRKLTDQEIAETVKYCRHDVEQTIGVFMQRRADFDSNLALLQMYGLPLDDIGKTKTQLSAVILEAKKKTYDDEFDISFPDTLKIKKYGAVVDWYKDPKNRRYKEDPSKVKSKPHQLEILVSSVKHVFGWGGVHGAIENYHGTGYFLNMDVASLYPSLMIQYALHSRSCNPAKFKEIYDARLMYKRDKHPWNLPLKLLLNVTYGGMKDKYNALYDPRQANNVCVYGQLLILDLIEKLESRCQIIQSNTDGILIKMRSYDDFDTIDDICHEWEQRTRLTLEFDEYKEVYQKDVNNYVLIPHGKLYDKDGKPRWKSIGTYVKKLNNLDYDLPILNKALIEFMVKGTPIETTIEKCNDLKEFQQVKKIGSKYTGLQHGFKILNEKCVRVFASKDQQDGGIYKMHATTKRLAKVEGTPEHAFIYNDSVNGVNVLSKLDKKWYVDVAKNRLKGFGL